VAEKAVGIILNFLVKEGPTEQAQALISQLPGADTVMEKAQDAGGGLFGGMGGIMGVGSRLMSAGLSMGEVQGVTKEIIAFAREKAGEDTVGALVGAIPGLSQFI
jgi:hypothetical protein